VKIMKRFCAICGREVDVYYDNLCLDCFRKNHPLLSKPLKLKITICRECNSIFYLNKWVKGDLESILLQLIRREVKKLSKGEIKNVEISVTEENKSKYTVLVTVVGRARHDMPYYKEEYMAEVRVRYEVCPVCRDIILKKEKAILQVRALNRELSLEEKKRILEIVEIEIAKLQRKQRNAVIVDIEDKKGLDIKLLSANVARALAAAIQKEFPALIKETYKLIRLDRNGRPVSKVTVKVELPPFSKGDVVDIKGTLFYVKEIKRGIIKLVNLSTYKTINVTSKTCPKSTKRVSVEKEKYLVNSITPPVVSLLNLASYETIEARLPVIPQWLKVGGTIEAVNYRGRIYVLPP